MINVIYKYVVRIRAIKASKKLFKVGIDSFFGRHGTIVGGKHMCIGKNFSIGENYKLQVWENAVVSNDPVLVIHDNVSIMDNCQISCCKSISIGDGCLFGDNVFITDNFHGDNSPSQLEISPIDRPLYVKDEVHIGKNVWIGRNVCIMPGVTIGDGAVIGSNAVVTHDIPAYSIAVGVPAKVIKKVK